MTGRRWRLALIAETGERFADFAPYAASVNDSGVVAFQAGLRDGGTGVFTGDRDRGEITTVIGGTSESVGKIRSHPDIDSRGATCFYADGAAGMERVILTPAPRATPGDPWLDLTRGMGPDVRIGPLGPTMNDDGRVAFRADLPSGESGIFVSDGRHVVTLADTATSGRFAAFHGLPVIDGSGAVVFRADLRTGAKGIFAATAGGVEALVETGTLFADLSLFPSTNDRGAVVFAGALRSGESGIFTATRGHLACLTDTTGPFESFRGALVDDAGTIVFFGVPRGERFGIFSGTDPREDRLLAVGDELFGATVESFALNPVSMSGAGHVAIRVALTGGRQVVVRADSQ